MRFCAGQNSPAIAVRSLHGEWTVMASSFFERTTPERLQGILDGIGAREVLRETATGERRRSGSASIPLVGNGGGSRDDNVTTCNCIWCGELAICRDCLQCGLCCRCGGGDH